MTSPPVPPPSPAYRPSFGARMAGVGARVLHWRAKHDLHEIERPPRSRDPVVRGFIQINLIRPH